ncbi:glycoside hydrolase family 3 N-terminal domain-containing protein [Parenemella sanctibonifatiensis]|uniref:beta-N-acetylhexosaminidase n=1 Tax=Parenemella sanctibonifatiensis TaxID=2016505 RepID=A0A255ELW3_9ACTN|nr:glycoside hydrolase family 3 N-terminal domain-containing protein [Parenemella sanctibonifatiensis]OYN92538.1 glycoside hydrolase family 3 [Parenemella sanctibonifatiensis]
MSPFASPARRRRLSLVGLGLALALLAACSAGPAPEPPPSPVGSVETSTEEPTAIPSDPVPSVTVPPEVSQCRSIVEHLPLELQVGQLLMLGVQTNSGVGEDLFEVMRSTNTGSILLLGNYTGGVSGVRELTDQVRESSGVPLPLAVAADQEGGQVQRLRGSGFDRIPSAAEQAELDPDELRAEAETWATQLKDAGVDWNLAPVGDVVPQDKMTTNEPIGRLDRGYGSDPAAVAVQVEAFIEGMDAAGMGTSVKHFPGLGEVEGNTDLSADVRDEVTGPDSPSLTIFQQAIAAGADMVMISSATYTRIDPDHPGVYSPALIEQLLREQLGYGGLVISDDLGEAEAAAQLPSGEAVPAGERAVLFIQAGGDLVINANPALQQEMADALLAKAEADPAFRERITESASRVLGAKAARGLMLCQ